MAMDGIQPVVDINRNNNDCWGGGNWMWIIVLLFFFCGGGWGNNGDYAAAAFANGAMTRNEITNGFDAQDIKNGIRGIQNGLCDGFYAQNTTMLQGFNNTQRDIMQTGYQLGSAIAENRFAAQQCCCETNRNIDSVKAENYRNTCEITTAIHAEGEATRALINANVMQELRDRLADRDRDLLTANMQLSQQAQTATIVNTVRPFPQPAYITCSPYTSVNGFGCGNSCGGC